MRTLVKACKVWDFHSGDYEVYCLAMWDVSEEHIASIDKTEEERKQQQ